MSSAKQMNRWLLEEFFRQCHVMLVAWLFAHNNKGKVPAGRQRQREALLCCCACARKLSLLGGAWCCRWHSPAYNDPDSERSTVPLSPSLLPLASMQTLDAATFESRFQIREQILFQIPFSNTLCKYLKGVTKWKNGTNCNAQKCEIEWQGQNLINFVKIWKHLSPMYTTIQFKKQLSLHQINRRCSSGQLSN